MYLQQWPIYSARSAEPMRSEFGRLNTEVLVLLCSPPLESWVPPLQLLISVWPSFCPLSGRPHTVELHMSWLHCHLGFSLLHSAIMCIRGSHSSSGRPLRGHFPASFDMALEEGCFGAVWAPFFFLKLLSCLARTIFVLGVVGKGSPSSPGRKKIANIKAVFKLQMLEYNIIHSNY